MINDNYLNLYNEKSRWGMTSGNKTPVLDSGSAGHSVFAHQLLNELENNEKPFVTAQEIFTRIAPIIVNNSEQTPVCRPIRNTGDQGGEFIFIASSAAMVETPAKPTVPAKSTLSIEANVTGATVYVDGKKAGASPLDDYEVTSGKHAVRVEKEGYHACQKGIQVEGGRGLSLSVFLKPTPPPAGRLFVDTDPDDCMIRILNNNVAFQSGMELASGSYELEVSAAGHEKKVFDVSIRAGQDKQLDVRLSASASKQKPELAPVPLPSEKKIKNSLGMELVYIAPGTFTMGSPSGEFGREENEIQRDVTLTRGFYLQTTEVTQAQWHAIMGKHPSNFRTFSDDRPVEQVSWNDAQQFIHNLNEREGGNKYRLPSEAEWEYAARAGSQTPYCFGEDEKQLSDYAWYKNNSKNATHPVGQKQPNAWGLYDMHGNVWEWCQDWYEDYPLGSVTDPQGPEKGLYHMIRGGSWEDYDRNCRSGERDRYEAEYIDWNRGRYIEFMNYKKR